MRLSRVLMASDVMDEYNDPVAYAELIPNGDPETYLKTVTEYKPLDS